jgi:predicted transcriptional regulator
LNKDLSVIGRFTKKKKNNYSITMDGKSIPLPLEKITECSRDLESYSTLIREMQSYLSLL